MDKKDWEIVSLDAKIERLQEHAESEYQRGLEEGRSCQAILEIQGRERFLAELREAESRNLLAGAPVKVKFQGEIKPKK